jgi:copper homeostasis protein
VIKLEICCASAADGINAFNGGADRIELNSAIAYGGLTPVLADLKILKNKVPVPVMVMIRPRSGGFCYSEVEFESMKKMAELAVNFGADGLVFGILKENGDVDIERNKILKEIAGDKTTVFHRAFDVIPDPFEAIDKIKEIGIDRILTSAQSNKVADNLCLAKKILEYAEPDLEIVLAGGIRDYNLKKIIDKTGCSQVHLSAFIEKEDKSMLGKRIKFNSSCISEAKYKLIDSKKVKAVKEVLDSYFN